MRVDHLVSGMICQPIKLHLLTPMVALSLV